VPLTHVRTFCVRHYECDADGHVYQANYLRYMQEAAFDASAAAGYDLQRYEALDRTWLVRETEIEYLWPLRYADRVEVKTWVQDFRRVRSRRAYEFRLASTERLVARALTDWVYLETSTLHPAVISEELKANFCPEGIAEQMPSRQRFPRPPAQPLGVFCQERRVEWRDLDPAGHANNAVYLNFIEDCGIQMMAAHGWPLRRMAAEGFALVARQHRIEYKAPALLDDKLEVRTWLSAIEGSSVVRHSAITRASDGALVLRGRTLHVWLDLQSQRPTALPEALLKDLAPLIAAEPLKD